jgi:hypothetical protein
MKLNSRPFPYASGILPLRSCKPRRDFVISPLPPPWLEFLHNGRASWKKCATPRISYDRMTLLGSVFRYIE